MQEEKSETKDFLAMRQETGLTIAQAAKLAGWSPAAVCALEKKGEGSSRLREKLISVYAEMMSRSSAPDDLESEEAHPCDDVQDEQAEPSLEEWKRRALAAEAKLKHLQEACNAMGQHVEALGCTVRHFSNIISE